MSAVATRDHPRACDICGVEWNMSKLQSIGGGRYACPDDFPGVHDPQCSRLAASSRPFPPPTKPLKSARPSNVIPLYAEESRILSLLASKGGAGIAPISYFDVTEGSGNSFGTAATTAGLTTAGWTGIYLYELIAENKRPLSWIEVAKTKLRSIADWLLGQQVISTVQTAGHGRFNPSSSAEPVVVCGLTMLYAYRVFGTLAYLRSAQAAMQSVRQHQSSDAYNAWFVVNDGAGGTSRWHSGTITTPSPSSNSPRRTRPDFSGVALWFMRELQTTCGDADIYGAAAGGGFAVDWAATLSEMQAELRAYWAAQPWIGEDFDFWTSGGGTNAWRYAGTDAFGSWVTSLNWAKGLWGIHKAEGYSAQVATAYTALRAFASNPALETPANTSRRALLAGLTGKYDPKLCLAQRLRVAGTGSPCNHDAVYEWATVGLLGEIQSAHDQASFRLAKDALTPPRDRYADPLPHTTDVDYPALRGRSGLSHQVSFTEVVNGRTGRFYDLTCAAMVGLAYREQPQMEQIR